MNKEVLGIDIGGSGVKGAVIDLKKGTLVTERVRIPTPTPHSPQTLLDGIQTIIDGFGWKGVIGCGFPGVIRSQTIETAANIGGKKFIGINLAEEIGIKTGLEAWIVNDADAAGVAELRYGAGRGCRGVVLMLTVGTGIGSSMFIDGTLVPNLEFGHLKCATKIPAGTSPPKGCAPTPRGSRTTSSGSSGPCVSTSICSTYSSFAVRTL